MLLLTFTLRHPLKVSHYLNRNFRLFGIIGFEFQNPPVVSGNARYVGEINLEELSWLNFFYPVGEELAEGKLDLIKCKGALFFCPDEHGFTDFPVGPAPQICMFRGNKNGYLDKGLKIQDRSLIDWIVSVHLGTL